ncbi:probable serine incorporator isoform X2 [Olea europaea var. sylvestris]|uniref:probable serine incorporator isoform X2 n=1 Tax=Olea europaea var. sylvestris TaxID=158386 RepID=UPI000C1D6821|nr:probable serine incorporator isoform X2 [Olea europaea var. sylvestris]
MESTTSSTKTMYSMIINGSWFDQFRNGSNPWMARYAYSLMFLITNLLAWAVRDYGHSALTEMKRLKECEGGKDCLGAEGVLRVSLGCFTFYFAMFLSTAGTSKLDDRRECWHSGWWSAKIVMKVVLIILSFLVPTEFISLYGQVAHFGAGRIHVMLLATAAYVVCILGIILMYIWYTPQPSCLLNIFFITWTLVLLQLMTSVSLHPNVNAGFVTPGFMGLYLVFLCWSAIRSEPPEEKCIQRAGTAAKRDWLTIISFVVAVLAMVIATFSTGIDSQCFQFMKKERQEEDDVPYGYGFFHFVFATGAMYFAMLLIGWNTHHTMKKWTIDVGWTSTWVKIVNEWLGACIYIWMLVAPIILKSRQAELPAP